MIKNKTRLPENTGDGLGRRFTQNKLHEGKILKQVDRELANDRKRKDNKNQQRSTYAK